MWEIIGLAVLHVVLGFALRRYCRSGKASEKTLFYIELIIMFAAVYLYLMLSIYRAFGDINDFVRMMKTLTENGFYGCYESGGIVYPPVAQYYFWIIGTILQTFGVPLDTKLRIVTFAIKLPCIVCVFLMAWIVNQACHKCMSKKDKIVALYLILLNPGFLFTTGYVCQVDAIYVFLILLTLWLLINEKRKLAYFVFAASILFKFQTIFITPVIVFVIIDQVFLQDFSWKKFWGDLLAGLSAIGCMGLCYVPFIYDFSNQALGQGGMVQNFTSTIAGFGKASQNAYNFWTLMGYNEVSQTVLFGPLSCQTWGNIFIVLLVLLVVLLYARMQGKQDIYPMLAALLVSGMYCFAVRMMSRYLYPAVILLFLGYAMRPTRKRFWCTTLMSSAFFVETAVEYLIYPWRTYNVELIAPYIISAYCIGCFLFLVYTIWSEKDDRYELV